MLFVALIIGANEELRIFIKQLFLFIAILIKLLAFFDFFVVLNYSLIGYVCCWTVY